MAKQYKKLQNKIHPKAKEAPAPKAKIGKDYFLLVMIGFTVIILTLGWSHLDDMNKAMYVLLTTSLCLTYTRRHFELTDTQRTYVDRASFASIGLAVALFLIIAYQQYIA
ncbi:MAG TPA: hypothetical protein DEP57_02965 [Selenomonas sp.]|nr:hypothetical protein [Selenomonas sp.]